MAEAFGALDTHMCKVLTVHSQQVTVEQALFSCLIIAVLAVMQFGLPVLDNELVRAQGTGLVVAPCVLRVFWRALVVVQQLVTLQVVVETDLLVGGKVAVCALVLLLKQVVRVVFHVAFEEAS